MKPFVPLLLFACVVGPNAVNDLVAQDLPLRFSLGGLGKHVTILSGDEERGITAVSPAGDVDGDGLEDLLLRFAWTEALPPLEEDVVLLYGFDTPGEKVDVFSLRKTVIRTGISSRQVDPQADAAARAVGGGLDVNGDSGPDILVASSFERTTSGTGPAILVVFGGDLPETVDRGAVGGEVEGTVIVDPSGRASELGIIATLLEDVNGDGLAEIGVVSPGFTSGDGAVFVIFGSASFPPVLELAKTGGDVPGFVFSARQGTSVRALESMGDLDGDGLSEIGMCGRSLTERRCYVLYGTESFPPAIGHQDVVSTLGVVFDDFGSISRAGDTDGDGRVDILLSEDRGPDLVDGRAHLIGGRAAREFSPMMTPDAVASLERHHVISQPVDRTSGFGTTAPRFVLGPGSDLNHDGKSEFVLGTPRGRHVMVGPVVVASGGGVYVVRGGVDLPAKLDSERIGEELGMVLDGVDPQGHAGDSVFLMPDFDGDGSGEILIVSAYDPQCEHPEKIRDYKVWIVSGAVLAGELPPLVGAIHPPRGAAEGGNLALVVGAGFAEGARVFLGEEEAEIREVLSSGLVTVTIPPRDVPAEVTVRVQSRGMETSDSVLYGYSLGRSISVQPGGERSIAVSHDRPDLFGLLAATFAGDLNNDGRTDMALLEVESESVLTLVFGGTGRADILLDALQPPGGVRITSPRAAERLFDLRAGGDVNGDGFDDLLLRTEVPDERQQWRLVLGRAEFPEGVVLQDLEQTVRVTSDDPELRPRAMAIVPDLDGDGLDDMIFTARGGGDTQIFVVLGSEVSPEELRLESAVAERRAAHLMADINLAELAGPAGDFDGIAPRDIFIGGPGVVQGGALAILYMSPFLFSGRSLDLSADLFGGNGGVLVAGPSLFSGLEFRAAVGGDMDGDGFPELLMRRDDLEGCTVTPRAGEVVFVDYETIVTQGAAELPEVVRSSYAARRTGLPDFVPGAPGAQEDVLTVRGAVAGDGLGIGVSGAGDFDGDGFQDAILGAGGAIAVSATGRSAYVILGGQELYARSVVDLAAPSEGVIQLVAPDVPGFGQVVSGGADWDGDGRDDVLIGGRDGRVFVVFGSGGERTFVRGDTNLDGEVNITDPVLTLTYLFQGGLDLSCLDAADADDDGTVIITDSIFTLTFLFGGGPPPPMPYPLRGEDPTHDTLECKD